MSPGPSPMDREAAARTKEVAQRAIRRLDLLEVVMIGGGAVLALLGGAVVAWLVAGVTGAGFRPTWIVASLVLFVVPGIIAIIRIRKDAEEHERRVAAVRDGLNTDRG